MRAQAIPRVRARSGLYWTLIRLNTSRLHSAYLHGTFARSLKTLPLNDRDAQAIRDLGL